jgi:hypothetical protein
MAEFGFFGVRVMTCTQTPRRNGLPFKAGDFDLMRTLRRPLRTSWLMVGMWEKGNLQSENLGKEVNATLHPKLGKNFLGENQSLSCDPGLCPAPREKNVHQPRPTTGET